MSVNHFVLINLFSSDLYRLRSEHLSDRCLEVLLSILQSAPPCLRELCLVCFANANVPVDYFVFCALESPFCTLETLRSV